MRLMAALTWAVLLAEVTRLLPVATCAVARLGRTGMWVVAIGAGGMSRVHLLRLFTMTARTGNGRGNSAMGDRGVAALAGTVPILSRNLGELLCMARRAGSLSMGTRRKRVRFMTPSATHT